MDWAMEIIHHLPTAVLAFLVYLIKREHKRLETKDNELLAEYKELRKELIDFKPEAQEKYADNDEVGEIRKELRDMRDNIDTKLDRLMDLILGNAVNIAKQDGRPAK